MSETRQMTAVTASAEQENKNAQMPRHRIEQMISLPEAASLLSVSRRTLRRWLRQELGIIFPPGRRGVRRLVRIRDVEILVRVHAGYPDWTKMRGGSREAA